MAYNVRLLFGYERDGKTKKGGRYWHPGTDLFLTTSRISKVLIMVKTEPELQGENSYRSAPCIGRCAERSDRTTSLRLRGRHKYASYVTIQMQ